MKKKYIAIFFLVTAIGLTGGCGASGDKDIGKDKAQEIAFSDANVNESDISKLHISKENEDGKTVYDIQFTDMVSGTEYDYEILAADGTIQKVDQEKNNPVPSDVQQTQNNEPKDLETESNEQNISQNEENGNGQSDSKNQNSGQNGLQANVSLSLEDAKKLALDRVTGATENDIRIKLDYDDGYYVYEGEVFYGQKEYEFEIDANTGTFLEWSEEIR